MRKQNFSKNSSSKSNRSSSVRGQSKAVYNGQQRARSQQQTSSQVSISVSRSWRQITGTHAVKEVLHVRPGSVKQALVQRNLIGTPEIKEIIALMTQHGIRFEERSDVDLNKLCPSQQGVVLFSDYNPAFDYTVASWDTNSLVLALDGVEDPHNLGAVMRTSWLMGVNGIVIPQDRAVGLTATVHKVACGGVEHVELARMNNFHEPFETLKEAGFWVYGLSHKAKKSIYEIEYPEKVIWVLGAEDKGLRVTTERLCDELVSIPQLAADASYNVSVATAIALSETKRQWSLKK